MDRTKDYISRLYPILFSEEFKGIEHAGTTRSAAGLGKLREQRQQLVRSALRYGQPLTTKKDVQKPPSEMTTFKPFSVRELDFDVWDTSRSNRDKFLAQLHTMQRGPA